MLAAAWEATAAVPASPERNPARLLRQSIAEVPEAGPGIPAPLRNPVRALDRTGAMPAGHVIPPVPERNPALARPATEDVRAAQPATAEGPPLPERKPRQVNTSGIPPLPERAPGRKRTPAEWSPEEIAAAKTDCERMLAGLAVDWSPLPPIREGACGTPFPIAVKAVGRSRAEIDPPATLNCRMAASLARWLDEVVQPLAAAELKSPVTRLGNGTSYACRGRRGSASGKLSEHAFANALDLPAFKLADGRTVAVLGTWGPTLADIAADIEARKTKRAEAARKAEEERQKKLEELAAAGAAETVETPPAEPAEAEEPLPELPEQKRGKLRVRLPQHGPATPEARFLHAVHARACALFGTVLGPEANEAHRDHLHLDHAKRRTDNFCE
jgi:hypothetical protein